MRVLNKYLIHDFLLSFIVTLLVFTFVMYIGAVIKAIDLLSRGVSGLLIIKIFALNIPFTLTFAIPMSVLTTVLLLFGRLSFDGEITAMKACGLSMWQIVSPVVMVSILLSVFCFYINGFVMPDSHYARRKVLVAADVEDPVNLLEEGRFVRDFPGLMVYVGKKGSREVSDVIVYELDGDGIKRNVRAKSGTVNYDQTNKVLEIDLKDVRIDQPDQEHPQDMSKSRYLYAKRYPVRLDFSELAGGGNVSKKAPDMDYFELIQAIRDVRRAFPDVETDDLLKMRMKMMVDGNQRLAFAVSCFAFTLLGIPLGLRSHRRESSIGVGISLLLVFVFYMFIIISDSMVGYPQYRPDLIVWLPVLVCQAAGFYLLFRSDYLGG
ncbi:MAG: LptF/LptG family permease [Lentisphaerota bacterium]